MAIAFGSIAPAHGQTATAPQPTRSPDVIYVPTPHEVVEAMLKVAKVTKNDVVYDLGCGDGRIPIAAGKIGARGIGIDIDPQRIKEAEDNLKQSGLPAGRVKFMLADLFETNIGEASVVTLYLLPSLNVKLIPKLMKELKPGTRIVSHAFDMGDWKPEQELDVNGRKVYYWTVPANKTRPAASRFRRTHHRTRCRCVRGRARDRAAAAVRVPRRLARSI
jgi:tRNA G10  N-methylase Trm11